MSSSRLSAFCDRALEAGWLLGVTITPVFFNVYSSRVFEPDKLTTLRALATVMAMLWLVRLLEEILHKRAPLRFSWRTPMVLPALVLMAVYLISSAFSLVPYTSIVGSYQRLQGTFTLFGYLVIFFALITSLRTRAQLARLITALILNSLPISLYGIIQHNGLDPLPWAGDVTSRVASNMGNAIFVAAYLIMVVPLTAARIVQSFDDILSREEARVSDILRASGYIFIIAVQLLTIWYSQSRGPWLGIVAAAVLFPYLALIMLQRRALSENPDTSNAGIDILKGVGFGLGVLIVAGGLAGLSILLFKGKIGMYVGGILAALVFGGAWLYFIVERKGWRWLWVGWGTIGLAAATTLLLFNVPGFVQTQVRKVEVLRRLTTITELQSGTGKVRGLIWQGAVELLKPHAPLKFPDGSTDAFNAIRPLIGYGPESMYVAYNAFYPPELGHYESRTASPDRSHNETLDSLVITGVFGLAAYLFTFVSFFYWGLRWLGLLKTRGQLWLYLGLIAVFAITFFIIAWQLEGAYLFAVAIPLGVLVGTMVYMTVEAFREQFSASGEERTTRIPHPHTILIIGLLAGVIGHFVEINFGIAIASTRTTFWAFAGLLVVLGLEWVPGIVPATQTAPAGEQRLAGSQAKRRRRPTHTRERTAIPAWLAAVLALSFVATFLLGTLAFDFINNPERLTSAGDIFVNSLTMKYHPEKTKAYGALMIFIFTWLLFGVVGLSEFDREGLFDEERSKRWGTAIAVYALISLLGLLIFGNLLAAHQANLTATRVDNTSLDKLIRDVVGIADKLASLVLRYYGLIFFLLALTGIALLWEDPLPREWGEFWSPVALIALLVFGATVIIGPACYNLIRADIIYKQGGVYAGSNNANEKQIGIAHYEKALEYVPREDYYNLFLGKAYLELAQGLPAETSAEQREFIFRKTEEILKQARQINPLNTDHSANLARFYKSWAARVASEMSAEGITAAQQTTLKAQYDKLLQQSEENYKIALTLSPNNPIIWNELAQLYAIDFGDDLKFQQTISTSLQVDVGFEQTWMLLGDMRSSKGDLAGAVAAYQESLKIRNNCTVRRVLGTLQAQQTLWADAAATLEEAVEKCAQASDLWDMYRVLAITYANLGRLPEALQTANLALAAAPTEQQPAVQQLIEQLQAQLTPPESTPTTQP
ncbi:MAG TPA: tetratricopeptide repeat protein [Anaerolineae bacterium]|nr:tetratricopeptide repeat protein [Anaerolineae bacterium]HQI87375.1 tetratricopeptide repeat protein [Anaerolineae bacterium]